MDLELVMRTKLLGPKLPRKKEHLNPVGKKICNKKQCTATQRIILRKVNRGLSDGTSSSSDWKINIKINVPRVR